VSPFCLTTTLQLTVYTLTGLIFCLLTWFNVWTNADVVRVGNRDELISQSPLLGQNGAVTHLLIS